MFSFSDMSRPDPGPPLPPIHWTPEKLSRGKCGRGLRLATYLHLDPRLRTRGPKLPRPLFALMEYIGRNLHFYLCIVLFKPFLGVVGKYLAILSPVINQNDAEIRYNAHVNVKYADNDGTCVGSPPNTTAWSWSTSHKPGYCTRI